MYQRRRPRQLAGARDTDRSVAHGAMSTNAVHSSRCGRFGGVDARQGLPSYFLSYSDYCYRLPMGDRPEVLRAVMADTRTGQSELARLSGVRQPSISQFLSGRTPLSDEQLDRLLSCMGYRLQVTRRPAQPELTLSERRSWLLHREIARKLTRETLHSWRPTIAKNLLHLRTGVTGEPHTTNIGRWEALVADEDLPGLHRILTGLNRDSIELREVSPMSGLLSDEERQSTLAAMRS